MRFRLLLTSVALTGVLCAQEKPPQRPAHVILFVMDGLSWKAWDHLKIPTLRRLASEGTLVAKEYLPPPAHPKAGAYAEIHSSSIANPVMMAGTIFIDRQTKYLPDAFPPGMKSAFIVNSLAYQTLTAGYTYVEQRDTGDAFSVHRALELMRSSRPAFMRVHLQNAGSAGFQCLSTTRNVAWRNNIWSADSPYRLATERADSLLGIFLEELKSSGLLNSVAVIVVGDHGQDDGGWHPLQLPDGAITTMVLWGKGIRRGTTMEYAEHVDIVPTVCALLGLTPPATVQGRALDDAIAWSSPSSVPRPRTQQQLNDVLREHHFLLTSLTSRLDTSTSPRRGFFYYRLGLIGERFAGLDKFTGWSRFRDAAALLENDRRALDDLRALADEFSRN